MIRLSQRQAQVLDLIERSSVPPTLRELGLLMGIRSTNGVNDHLRALERKGRIRRADFKTRQIHVLVPLTSDERAAYDLGRITRCMTCGQVVHTELPLKETGS